MRTVNFIWISLFLLMSGCGDGFNSKGMGPEYVDPFASDPGTPEPPPPNDPQPMPPALLQPLTDLTLTEGPALSAGEFCVSASGENLNYSWFKDGAPAPFDQNRACYLITKIVASDSGSYTVKISNEGGEVSSTARLLVTTIDPISPPTISKALAPITINVGSSLGTNQFCVSATGENLTYSWFKDGAKAPYDANKPCYLISQVALTDAGTYKVEISNSMGSANSSATLTVSEKTIVKSTRVLGLSLAYSDTTLSTSAPAALQKVLNDMAAFYNQGSFGKHELIGITHPKALQLADPRPAGSCVRPNTASISNAINAAGIDIREYSSIAIVVPNSLGGCTGGVATGGSIKDPTGAYKYVGLAFTWSMTNHYIRHEILHTMGLGHAKSISCTNAMSLGANCAIAAYGNRWDVMGDSSGMMISAPLRETMGWTAPTVHKGGTATYTIHAATQSGGNSTAVKVPLTITGRTDLSVTSQLNLYIEYRPPIGFDSGMANSRWPNWANGAMINVTGSWRSLNLSTNKYMSCPQSSPCLVDTTPTTTGTRSHYDAGLPVGSKWTEPLSGVSISVTERTDTTLTVVVESPP